MFSPQVHSRLAQARIDDLHRQAASQVLPYEAEPERSQFAVHVRRMLELLGGRVGSAATAPAT